MASPMILSTRPPKLVMSCTRRSKHPSTSSLICSGSRVSESAVKPTKSAKTTVATRRSSLRLTSCCPQVGQKRDPSPASPPQDGQVICPAYGRPLTSRSGLPSRLARSGSVESCGRTRSVRKHLAEATRRVPELVGGAEHASAGDPQVGGEAELALAHCFGGHVLEQLGHGVEPFHEVLP